MGFCYSVYVIAGTFLKCKSQFWLADLERVIRIVRASGLNLYVNFLSVDIQTFNVVRCKFVLFGSPNDEGGITAQGNKASPLRFVGCFLAALSDSAL